MDARRENRATPPVAVAILARDEDRACPIGGVQHLYCQASRLCQPSSTTIHDPDPLGFAILLFDLTQESAQRRFV